MKSSNIKQARTFILIASVLVFVYVALRALLLSFTHDECFSFLHYSRGSWENINDLKFTNNHLLNSWLMKICYKTFGDSEFSLRLPNVLSFILFLYFGGKLLLQIKDLRMMIMGWIFLFLNPFVLDFFSLARGYGISMGLMMMGIHGMYILLYSSNRIRNIFFAMIPVCLALLANLTMINFLLAFTFTISLLAIFSMLGLPMCGQFKKRNWWPVILIPLALLATELIYIMPLMLGLKNTGNFDFGGTAGFWADTVWSLVRFSSYDHAEYIWPSRIFLQLFIALPLLFICIRALVVIFSRRFTERINFVSILSFILLLCVVAVILQNKFFHIPYPLERVGIYFIPLFSLIFIFWLSGLRSLTWKKIVSSLVLITNLIIFSEAVNLHYFTLWKYDSETKLLMANLEELFTKDKYIQGFKPLGIDFLYKPSFNYYRFRNRITYLEPSVNEDIPTKGRFDYYILPPWYKNDQGMVVYAPESKQVEVRKNGSLLLFTEIKKFAPVDFEDPDSHVLPGIIKTNDAFDGSYVEALDTGHAYGRSFIDTIKNDGNNKDVLVSISAMVRTPNTEADAMLVISVERAGKLIFWQGMSIRDFIYVENEWSRAVYSTYLPDELLENDRILCYLWNSGKVIVWTDQLTLNLYKLQ